MLNISETVQDIHSYSEILVGTYALVGPNPDHCFQTQVSDLDTVT